MEEMEKATLDKIDLIRQRLGVSYREAKEALEKNNGDIVEALVFLEGSQSSWNERLESEGMRIWEKIKGMIKQGNVNRLRLKKGDKVLAEIPVNLGAIGVVGAVYVPPIAVLGVIGTLAALANQCTIEILRADGTIEEKELDLDE